METVPEFNQLIDNLQKKLNTALSSLTRHQINLTIKKCGVVPILEVHNLLVSEQSTTAIYIPIMGDVIGDIFLLLPENSAKNMVDAMLDQPLGTTKIFNDFATSALKEMGNITTGVIVTEIANLLKLSMMLTVPNIATDMVGALIDQVLIEYGETTNELLAMDLPFTIEEIGIKGNFFLLFDQTSSQKIAQKINALQPPQEGTAT